jgi:hypothetical protein
MKASPMLRATEEKRSDQVECDIGECRGKKTYAEEMAVMKSWIDMTIERIDLGASASRENARQ